MVMRRFRKGRRRVRPRRARRATTALPVRTMTVSRPLRVRNSYYFSRYGYYAFSNFTTDAAGQIFGAIMAQGFTSVFWNPTIGQVNLEGSSEFSALFDQYKLHSYTVEFIPRWDSKDLEAGTNYLPSLYYYFDTDDNNPPANAGEVMQRPHVRRVTFNKPIVIKCKSPTVASNIYQSALTVGYGGRRSPWIDINSSAVPHYGIKFFIQGRASTTYALDFRFRFNMSFKNPR